MTEKELIDKLDYARDDHRDGYATDREYLDHISAIFDGNTEWALRGTHFPRLVVRMFLQRRFAAHPEET